jgi:hypothetical protein
MSDRKTQYYLAQQRERVEVAPAPDWRPIKHLNQKGEVVKIDPPKAEKPAKTKKR